MVLEKQQDGLHGFMSTLIPLRSQQTKFYLNYIIKNEETEAFVNMHKVLFLPCILSNLMLFRGCLDDLNTKKER